MVKPTGTDSVGHAAASSSDLQRARQVAGELSSGARVPAEVITSARQAWIDGLWRARAADRAPPDTSLFSLYTGTRDPADTAELLGELLALGPWAKDLLDTVLIAPMALHGIPLSGEEVRQVRSLLDVGPKARLSALAGLLERETPQPEAPLRGTPEQVLFDRPKGSPGLPTPEAESGGGDPDLDSLGDERQPEAARMAMLDRFPRPKVIEKLMALLNTNQCEFATTALIQIGRSGAAREVYQAALRVEGGDQLRPVGQYIRQAIEGPGAAGNDRPGRGPAREAAIGDRWLRRALDSFDGANILQASAGREALVIPRVARRLVEARMRARLEGSSC